MPTRRLTKRRVGRPCKPCRGGALGYGKRGGALGYGKRGGALGYGKKMDRARKFAKWVQTTAMPWMKKNKAVSRASALAMTHGRSRLGKHAGKVDKLGKFAATHGYGRKRVRRRKNRKGGSLGYY